jgi:hypothetical protein
MDATMPQPGEKWGNGLGINISRRGTDIDRTQTDISRAPTDVSPRATFGGKWRIHWCFAIKWMVPKPIHPLPNGSFPENIRKYLRKR